jgi:hypothetical protein
VRKNETAPDSLNQIVDEKGTYIDRNPTDITIVTMTVTIWCLFSSR